MGLYTSRKNFDFEKFVKILGRGRNSYIIFAIEEACGGEKKFKTAGELGAGIGSNSIVQFTDEYMESVEKQFKRLDSSFVYTPIMQVFEADYFQEYAYLTSKKTKYSFLIYHIQRGMNFTIDALKVYTNIKKTKLKNISNDIIKLINSKDSNCHRLIFNNDYVWKKAKIKKLFIKPVKLRQRSLTSYFEEGDEFGKLSKKKLKEEKRTHFYFLNSSRLSRYYNFGNIRIGKRESYDFIE